MLNFQNKNSESKLNKKGYKWLRVSQMLAQTPSITAHCQNNKLFPAYEGLWCKLIMAVTSYAMTKNSVAVIHGPANCAWAVRNFCATDYSLYYGNSFLHMPVTDINQDSVIKGGGDELLRTLLAVGKDYKPEHICVFDTCSTALIADDIETIISKARGLCSAKINYISSSGFSSLPLGQSIEQVAEKYAELMVFNTEKIGDAVNILGQYKEQQVGHQANKNFNPRVASCSGKGDGSGIKKCKGSRGKYPDDATELSRMIEAIGLKTNRILISGDIDYIQTATSASVNVISCPTWGIPLAKIMKKKFDVPYLKHSVPIGIEATVRWIRELAAFTGKHNEAEIFIEKETRDIKDVFDAAKSIVSGKIALIECGRNSQTAFARPMALARALQELGMIPYLFGLHPIEMKAKELDAEYFMWDGFDPMILFGNYAYQQPIDLNDVIQDLNLPYNDYLYFTQDVFPMERAGSFDISDVPRVETGVHLRRVVNAPGRGIGFLGAKALYESIIESVNLSANNSKSTLYGKVHGIFYEFEKNENN